MNLFCKSFVFTATWAEYECPLKIKNIKLKNLIPGITYNQKKLFLKTF